MENNQINNIVISPETIGFINNNDNINSIKILDLFPYYELKNLLVNDENIQLKIFNYLFPESPPKYTPGVSENTLNNHTKSILWNIGLLIYELYFGELPYQKAKKKII